MKNKNKQAGFHVFKTIKSKYYWMFYSKNGRAISHSEDYNSKQGAVIGIKSVLNILGATDMCLYYDHTGKEVDLFVIK